MILVYWQIHDEGVVGERERDKVGEKSNKSVGRYGGDGENGENWARFNEKIDLPERKWSTSSKMKEKTKRERELKSVEITLARMTYIYKTVKVPSIYSRVF